MEKFPELAHDIAQYQKNPAEFNAYYDELQKIWEKKNLPLLTLKEKAYEQVLVALKNEQARDYDQINQRYEETVNGLTQPLLQEKEATEQRLATLKFYQFGAKSEAKDRLAELENLLAAAENKKQKAKEKKDDQSGVVYRRYRAEKTRKLAVIEQKYPIERNPDLYRKRIIRFAGNIEYVRDISNHPIFLGSRLSEIVTYCVILTMQEMIGGLGISKFYGNIDLQERQIGSDSINEIGSIVLPTMLEVFGIHRYDRNEIEINGPCTDDGYMRLARDGILQIRKENDDVYFVVL